MENSQGIPQPQAIGAFNALSSKDAKPQEYYERIKQKFAEERDLRLKYRPEGTHSTLPISAVSWRSTRSTPTAAKSRPASRSTIPSNAYSSVEGFPRF